MAVVCGYLHTVCLSDEGTVYSFGFNQYGQLGDESTKNSSVPRAISKLSKIIQISCGAYFTICLDQNQKVWSFGDNTYGQLGRENQTKQNTPQRIQNIPPVFTVQCGKTHTLCITNTSELYSFGSNENGELCRKTEETNDYSPQSTGITAKAIGAGGNFTIIENTNGLFYGCGRNNYGQLGIKNFEKSIRQPKKINDLPKDIQSFVCGGYHCLFLDNKGKVYSVGFNYSGQLGIKNNEKQMKVRQISDLPVIKSISCGGSHSICLDEDGNIWTFGYNFCGQLGIENNKDQNKPIKINQISNSKQISHGFGSHTMIKDNENQIWVFGSNKFGQIALKDKSDQYKPTILDTQYSNIIGKKLKKRKNLNPFSSIAKLKNDEQQTDLSSKLITIQEIIENEKKKKKKDLFQLNSNDFSSWEDISQFLTLTIDETKDTLKKEQTTIDDQVKQLTDDLTATEKKLNEIRKELQNKINKLRKDLKTTTTKQKNFTVTSNATKNEISMLNSLKNEVSSISKNELNKQLIQLFQEKKIHDFSEIDICKLLCKMNLSKYQSIFLENHIDGDKFCKMIDTSHLESFGFEIIDICYFFYYREIMMSTNYAHTIDHFNDFHCDVCIHDTPKKTVRFLEQSNIPFDKRVILDQNWTLKLFLFLSDLSVIFNVEDDADKEVIHSAIAKWKETHSTHLRS